MGAMQCTRSHPNTNIFLLLATVLLPLSFTPAAFAAFTEMSCSVTVISGSSTTDTYRYSNCNAASSTITISSASAVTFLTSTFKGITHPNTMTGYSLVIQGSTITASAVNLIKFAAPVISSTISISANSVLTTTSWANIFDFQGGAVGSYAVSGLGMTIVSSTLKPSSDMMNFNGALLASTISISGTGITTGYHGFLITGVSTSLTIILSQLTMSCQYYNFYFEGAVTNSKFLLQTVIGNSNIIEFLRGNSGTWTNSHITVQGGSLSASITQTYKTCLRIYNLFSSSTITVTGATLLGDGGISIGQFTNGTISVIGSTITAASGKSNFAIDIGYNTDTPKSGTIAISSSTIIGDATAMRFMGTWTALTLSMASSTVYASSIVISMAGYMGAVTVTGTSVTITTTTTATGECIDPPSVYDNSLFQFTSSKFVCQKLYYIAYSMTGPSTTFSFVSSSLTLASALINVGSAGTQNTRLQLTSTSVTMSGGSLFYVGSSATSISSSGVSITSCTMTLVNVYSAGFTAAGTSVGLLITGTSGSPSTLSLSGSVFSDASTAACTYTSLSLTMANANIYTGNGVIAGGSSGYLTLATPSVSIASSVTITRYAIIFYGPITSGAMYFGPAVMTGSPSGGYHSFNGLVTSTTVTLASMAVTGPAGLSTWNGGCTSCSITISNVAATITGTSTASLIGFNTATYTGMQLVITGSSLSYTVSTASAFVALVFTSTATLSGSTLRVVGNSISSTTSATAHTVAFLYSASTTTIASSSVVTLAQTTVNVAVSTVTPIYLSSATVTGSTISLLCHSFASITVPIVRLNVFTASTLAVESVAVWSSDVAGLAAITIAGSSSTTATIKFSDSFMHAPVVVGAASTSSVSLIKADCSYASHSYALNPVSFVSGLQSVVTKGVCGTLTYATDVCWVKLTGSKSVTPSSSQSEEQTLSFSTSYAQSKSQSQSPRTPSQSEEHSKTVSSTEDNSISRSTSRSGSFSQSEEQSKTTTFSEDDSKSTSASTSYTNTEERSRSLSESVASTYSLSRSDSTEQSRSSSGSSSSSDSEERTRSSSASATSTCSLSRSQSSEQSRSSSASSSSSDSEERTRSSSASATSTCSLSRSQSSEQSRSSSASSSSSDSKDRSRSSSASATSTYSLSRSQTTEQSRSSTGSSSDSEERSRSFSKSPTQSSTASSETTASRSRRTKSKSFSPVLPGLIGLTITFPTSSGVAVNSTYYGASGVQVLRLRSLTTTSIPDGGTVAAALQLYPRLSDNRNVSWVGYTRSLQLTPTSLALTVSDTTRAVLGSVGTCTASYLPCTAQATLTPYVSTSTAAAPQLNVLVGYQSGVYQLSSATAIGFEVDRLAQTFSIINATAPSAVGGTITFAAALPPSTRSLRVVLLDPASNIAVFPGPDDVLNVTVTFTNTGGSSAPTTSVQQANVTITSSDVNEFLNPYGSASLFANQAGVGSVTLSLASGLPVNGSVSGTTSMTLNVVAVQCPTNDAGPNVTASADHATTLATFAYPLTADSDEQLYCGWGDMVTQSIADGSLSLVTATNPTRASVCSVVCGLDATTAAVSYVHLCRSTSAATANLTACEDVLVTARLPQISTPAAMLTALAGPSTDKVALLGTDAATSTIACGRVVLLESAVAGSAMLPADAVRATSLQLASSPTLSATLVAGATTLAVRRVIAIPWTNGMNGGAGWDICAVNITFPNGTRAFDLPLDARQITLALTSMSISATLRSGATSVMTIANFVGGVTSWSFALPDTACLSPSGARVEQVAVPNPLVQAFVNGSVTLQVQSAIRYSVATPPSTATALFLNDTASVGAVTVNTVANRSVTFDIRNIAGLLPTNVTPVATSVLIFRPDGYVDSANFGRVNLATPVIYSLDGCSSTYYPSTAECSLNGTNVLNIFGSGFSSTRYPNFIVGWQFTSVVEPIFCQTLVILSDAQAQCTLYPGSGLYGRARVYTADSDPANAVVLSTSNATMSYTLIGSLDCPVSANGLQCSGHGSCDFTSGTCTCYHTTSQGFWAGSDCSFCAQAYNTSVGCLKACPMNANGLICSGVGYCEQGQCWCGTSWSSKACTLCPGQEAPCSGHGTCDQSTGTCTCTLNDYEGYFNGTACDACYSGFSGTSCNLPCPQDPNGAICSGNGACYNGVCFCVAAYCGVRCELDKATQDCQSCANPSLYGTSCTSVCPGASIPTAPCNGHGVCDAGQLGTGTCQCSRGFGSPDCSVVCPISTSGAQCSGHGFCSLSSGLCQCDRFYATSSCSVLCPTAGGVACSGHGTCNEGSAGDGKCICLLGYGGNACNVTCLGDVPCNGHGLCSSTGICQCYTDTNNGFWGGSACATCSGGYAGTRCTQRCPQDASGTPCSGHGVCGTDLTCSCYASAGLGYWSGSACDDCSSGYYGASCLNECPGGACSPCVGNGVCSQGVTGTGLCACIANSAFGQWGGADCQSCVSGFYGTKCLEVCPKLAGVTCPNGACDDGPVGTGACICKVGFAKDANGHCIVCNRNYYGTLCLPCPSTTNGTCSGRGVCDDGVTGSGSCRCTGTAGGPACASNCPSTSDGTLCGNGGICSSTAGMCTCVGNYSLNAASGLCSDCVTGMYGTTCNKKCQPCGHGTCNRTSGACDCVTGYWGVACDVQCPGGANNSCSGHGKCDQFNGTCNCFSSLANGYFIGATCADCDAKYLSSTCKVPCPVLGGEICSGRGTCYEGRCSNCFPKPQEYGLIGIVCGYACELRDDSCVASSCPLGFYGLLCNQLCPGADPSNFNLTCSGQGLCDSTSGACSCNAGYYGDECSSSCPAALVAGSARVCSARGSCRGGVCGCLSGYFGPACETECPGGAATPCNARGVCANGTCTCYYGAVGAACESLCPGGLASPCSYHGVCQATGACSCYNDKNNGFFQGLQCDQCAAYFTGPTCTVQCLPSRGVIRGTSCACFPGFARVDCSATCTPNALGIVCGGHGTCVEQETCRCDTNYYGPLCTVFCTYALCQSTLGLYRPQCNVTTGECECRSSSIGQWTGATCSTCTAATWGDECNFPCSCNNHGVCGRNTGICSCYGDDVSGYWTGTACGECRAGYFGVTCRSINVALTPPVLPAATARDVASTPVNSWMLVDSESRLTLKGSTMTTTVDILGATLSGSIDTLRSLPTPLGTVNALIVNATHMLVVLIGGGKVFLQRNATVLLAMTNLPVPQQRGMQSLASASISTSSPAYFIANGSMLCSLRWSFGSPDHVECEGTTVFDFSGAGALKSVSFVAATALSGNAVAVMGDNPDGSSQWILVVYNFTTHVRTVFKSSTLHAGDVLRCTTENSDSTIICFIYNRALSSVALKRLRLTNGGAVILSEPVVDAALDANATAMGIDPDFDTGFVAFNFVLQPSRVLTFRLSTLLPIGSFDLSGFYIVTALSIDSASRLLLGVMEDDYSTAFITLNLFGIRAVVPNIVDLVGGALITVQGEGFDMTSANDTWCIVSGVQIEATLVDASTITCIAPQAHNSLSACVSDTIDVRFGSRSTSQKTIGILRPVSAGIVSAVTDYGTVGYGSYDAASSVTLSGFGFVNSPYAKCRLVNNSGHVVFVADAHYINSSAATCDQPLGLPPTDTWSGLQYSHDGTYFGTSSALFIIVGPAVHIVVVTDANTVVASTATKLFNFVVYTTDLFYNRRLVLETRQDSIHCSSNVPDVAIQNLPEIVPFTSDSARQVPLTQGASVFDNMYLRLPLAGAYQMYCFSFGDTKIATNFSYTVIPGPPANIAIITSASWYAGVLEDVSIRPRPSAWVQDVAGNQVVNLREIPPSMTLSSRRANVASHGLVVTYNTSVYVALPDDAAFYTFDGVFVRTAFDVATNLVFSTGYGVPSLVVPLPQQMCATGVQYSVPNTFNCTECPTEAYCDGSSLLVTRPGYWRGARTSLQFYECVPSAACPSSSYCKEGFTGRICATCTEGYGQSIDGCGECWPVPVAWVLNFVAFGVVCVIIYTSSIMEVEITSFDEFMVRKRLKQLNEERINALIIKLVTSHIQMLTAIPFTVLALPAWLKSLLATTKSSASADPNLVFITCTVAPTTADQLLLGVLLFPALLVVYAVASMVFAYIRSNSFEREEEELKRRIDIATGKYLMDERVEKAYRDVAFSSQARKVRRYARMKAKAEQLRSAVHHRGSAKTFIDVYSAEQPDTDFSEFRMESDANADGPLTHVDDERQDAPHRSRVLPPRRGGAANYAQSEASPLNNTSALNTTVQSVSSVLVNVAPAAPLDAAALEQHTAEVQGLQMQSSVFYGLMPEPHQMNAHNGAYASGAAAAAEAAIAATAAAEDAQQTAAHHNKAEFDIMGFILDADDNEPWDHEKVRRRGYLHGTMVSDKVRQIRSMRVLADSMSLTKNEETALEKYRGEVLGDYANEDEFLQSIADAKQKNDADKREHVTQRFINIFLVCVLSILFYLYPTLMEYSAKLLQCKELELTGGTVTVMSTNPEVLCDDHYRRTTRAFALVVLFFSGFGIPVLMSVFIVYVARTTCRAPGAGAYSAWSENARMAHLMERQAAQIALCKPNRCVNTDDLITHEVELRQSLETMEMEWRSKIARLDAELQADSLSLQASRSIFFFVSGRYKVARWYWESFSLIKKMVLVFINVFVPELSLQLLCSLYTMMVFYALNVTFSPWDDEIMDRAENLSLATLAVSFGLLQLLFYDTVEKSEELKNLIFITFVIINVATLGVLLHYIVKTVKTSSGRVKMLLRYFYRKYVAFVKRSLRKDVRNARRELRKKFAGFTRGRILEDINYTGLVLWADAEKTIAVGERRLSLTATKETPSPQSTSAAATSPGQQAAARRRLSLQSTRGVTSFDTIAVALVKHAREAKGQHHDHKPIPLSDAPPGGRPTSLSASTEIPVEPPQTANGAAASMSWLSTEQLTNDFSSARALVEMCHDIMRVPGLSKPTTEVMAQRLSFLQQQLRYYFACDVHDVADKQQPQDQAQGGNVLAEGDEPRVQQDDDASGAADNSPTVALPIGEFVQTDDDNGGSESTTLGVTYREDDEVTFLKVWLEHTFQAERQLAFALKRLLRSNRLLKGQLDDDERSALHGGPAVAASANVPTPMHVPSSSSRTSPSTGALQQQSTILASPPKGPPVRSPQAPPALMRPSSHQTQRSTATGGSYHTGGEDVEEVPEAVRVQHRRQSVIATPIARTRRASRYMADMLPPPPSPREESSNNVVPIAQTIRAPPPQKPPAKAPATTSGRK